MSLRVWPTLKGLAWDVKMTPEFFGLESKGVAPGFDTEISYGADPIYHFQCSYNVLRQTGAFDELHTIMNFFEAQQGKFQSFLLSLPTLTQRTKDGAVTGQVLTADGSGYAPLIITRPYVNENIYEAAGVNGNTGVAPVIKLNGVTKTPAVDYNILGPGVAVSGTTYPGLVIQWLISTTGQTITADFSWYYRVRFEQSTQEHNLFSWLLWEAQQVKMVGTRT